MGENHTERDFTIIMAITIVFFDVPGFLGSFIVLFRIGSGRDLLFIEVASVWIRLQSSALFKYLTSYLKGILELNIWL